MIALSNTISTAIFVLVALPFLFIAGVFVFIMLRNSRKASASRSWSVASGRIFDSHVGSHRSLDSNGTHTTIYDPIIQYEYSVNGQNYTSGAIRFGMQAGASWPQPAQQTVDQYPMDSTVQVFYNPANPSEAVLEHSTGGSNRTLTCVVALIIGIVVIGGLSMIFMQGFVSQIMKLVPQF